MLSKCLIIAGSAGSVEPILRIISKLHNRILYPIIVLIHMEEICEYQVRFLDFTNKVKPILDGEKIRPNSIYIVPPTYHTQIERDFTFSFSCDEAVYFSRPSIDVLVETAAYVYQDQLRVVILSGNSPDGSNGSRIASNYGANILVQSRDESQEKRMPEEVLNKVPKAIELTVEEIIIALTREGE